MRAISLITVMLLSLTTAAFGQGEESFFDKLDCSFDAGLSMPMGDASELHSMGFAFGVNCLYPYTDEILIGLRIAYNRWGIDDGGWVGSDVDGSSSMMEFVPQVRYLFPTDANSSFSFFTQAGIGFYRYAFDVDTTVGDVTTNYDDSDFNLGLCLGGGTMFEGAGRTWEIRPMAHIVFTEGNSTTYIGLTAGITF
ncbi:MAG TPA: hypothetical protein VLA34_01655 [Candidatus Krumholzibacterium sp.]|nr:hypothetical protein [Candidatus Krumholzibacterium sp.]